MYKVKQNKKLTAEEKPVQNSNSIMCPGSKLEHDKKITLQLNPTGKKRGGKEKNFFNLLSHQD